MDIIKTLLDSLPIEMWGHQIFPGGIFMNVVWAILPIIILKIYLKYQNKMSKIQKIMLGWFFIAFLPNALYLAFEIKHLAPGDHVADDYPIGAVLVFSGLCIVGLALTIYTIIKTVNNIKPLTHRPELSTLALGAVTSLGAVMGLTEASSIVGFLFPPIILVYAFKVATTPNLMITFMISWSLLSMVILLIRENFYCKSYYKSKIGLLRTQRK
jgi:uncharacterized membrane protein